MAVTTRESGSGRERTQPSRAERRTEPRLATELRVATATVDAVPDARTGQGWYACCDRDSALDVSRRGIRLACERPPSVGTRLLLELFLPGEGRPLDLVGCARWTEVAYEHGGAGARLRASVGVEIMGGSPTALDRYERALERLREAAVHSVATQGGLR
jgi:hypothetical protein